MAYMDQKQKARIAAELKKVMPKTWKYSLAVRNHSTLVLTISAAPADLPTEWVRVVNARPGQEPHAARDNVNVNPYFIEEQFDDSAPIMRDILAALNSGNHDRSDITTDYFDVGWYVDIHIGRWNKPFQVIG